VSSSVGYGGIAASRSHVAGLPCECSIALGAEIDAFADDHMLHTMFNGGDAATSTTTTTQPPPQPTADPPIGSKRCAAVRDGGTAHIQLHNYVELKTQRMIDSERAMNSFQRYKLLRWWIQSFIVGVPTIYVGMRNDQGLLLATKAYRTKDLPSMAGDKWVWCQMRAPDAQRVWIAGLICAIFLVDTLAEPMGVSGVCQSSAGLADAVYERRRAIRAAIRTARNTQAIGACTACIDHPVIPIDAIPTVREQ
jgi:hypothetical protein